MFGGTWEQVGCAHQEPGVRRGWGGVVGPVICAPWLAWPQGPPLGEEGMEQEHTAPQSHSRSHQTHAGGEEKSQDIPGNCT